MSAWVATAKAVWVLSATITYESAATDYRHLGTYDSFEKCQAVAEAMHDRFVEDGVEGILVTRCTLEE